MRPRLKILIVLSIITIIVTGCSSAKKDNAGVTPVPLPKLGADTITQAANYGSMLLGQFGVLESVMGRYKDLLDNPRLAENDWQIMVKSQNAAIDLIYQGVSGMTPPAPLKDLHTAALDGVGDCYAARTTVEAAITAVDANQLGQAAQQAKRCTEKLAAVKTELNAIADNNNLTLSEMPLASDLGGAAEAPAAAAGAAVSATGATGTVNDTANLRAGPGTNYNKVGGVSKGATVSVIGRNEAGDWLVVQTQAIPQAWIATFLVNGVGDVQSLPIVRPPP